MKMKSQDRISNANLQKVTARREEVAPSTGHRKPGHTWKMSVGAYLPRRGSLVPREVVLLSPGPRAAHPPLTLLLHPQHPLVPSGLSPTHKGPMPLPKMFISEGVSKPWEQSPCGTEVSKPEQIRLLMADSPVAKSRFFLGGNSRFPQIFSTPEN